MTFNRISEKSMQSAIFEDEVNEVCVSFGYGLSVEMIGLLSEPRVNVRRTETPVHWAVNRFVLDEHELALS